MTHAINIEKLLTEYAPFLARIVAIHEANPSLREDLLQEISLAVWRALESYRGEASIKTFVARIAHNRGVDHVLRETRRNDSINDLQSVDELPTTMTQANNDMQLDFISALYRLPLGYRQVITMQLEGFTQAEIGEVLGLNESAVAKRASRARQQLEKLF
ncbi:RNA polymerase sigma-70 factor, ECF subfamily [Arsukibacterium tuosuense]|uniref:RNA polymerase sigma-70 factor, ECF subfamily n=1 Tax=Arsukibacterium tuosuense TaxID=1323745 RepID=A0A285ID71_9GAMM|nr:RNA polymerase sigma factor [Arsukibacterium tuosuense]SNY45919.1 RNA polymerase sigma-70 factor, ECF subfamily [Arsukibacterium tuosuense]